MFRSIWNDMIHYFKTGNMVVRLILINVAVFVGVNILSVFMSVSNGFATGPGFKQFVYFFSVASDLKELVFHPWGLFTCMFLHMDFMHIFWNMLWLYWFGRIAGDMLNDKRILPIYIMGGFAGAVSFVLSSLIIGLFNASYVADYSLGASGAVMAIAMAAGTVAPDYRVNLILFETKLKYIVAVIIFLDVVGASNMGSGTDHFAHLGGAFFGWYFVYLLRRGNDLSVPFNRFSDRFFGFFQGKRSASRRPKPKVAFRNKEKIKQSQSQAPGRASDYGSVQEKIDAILDKISRKGIKSLTEEEQAFLNNYHNKLD